MAHEKIGTASVLCQYVDNDNFQYFFIDSKNRLLPFSVEDNAHIFYQGWFVDL